MMNRMLWIALVFLFGSAALRAQETEFSTTDAENDLTAETLFSSLTLKSGPVTPNQKLIELYSK